MIGKYLAYKAGKRRALKKINKKLESMERAHRAAEKYKNDKNDN